MIGDLSNARGADPDQTFLAGRGAAASMGRRGLATAIGKVDGVVDMLNGIDNTISSPATVFQVEPGNRRPRRIHARRKLPSTPPRFSKASRRRRRSSRRTFAYTIRVRYPDGNRTLAGGDEQHAAEQRHRTHGDSGHVRHRDGAAGADRDSPRKSAARRRGDRAPGRTRLGQRRRGRAEGGKRSAPAGRDSRGVWRNLRRAAAIVSRSAAGAGAGDRAGIPGAAVRIPHAGCARLRFSPRRCFRPRACFLRC